MLIVFSAMFITAGLAIRRNWWGVGDQISGKYVSSNPLLHERSWAWNGARVFGGLFVGMGFLMALAFVYITISEWVV